MTVDPSHPFFLCLPSTHSSKATARSQSHMGSTRTSLYWLGWTRWKTAPLSYQRLLTASLHRPTLPRFSWWATARAQWCLVITSSTLAVKPKSVRFFLPLVPSPRWMHVTENCRLISTILPISISTKSQVCGHRFNRVRIVALQLGPFPGRSWTLRPYQKDSRSTLPLLLPGSPRLALPEGP